MRWLKSGVSFMALRSRGRPAQFDPEETSVALNSPPQSRQSEARTSTRCRAPHQKVRQAAHRAFEGRHLAGDPALPLLAEGGLACVARGPNAGGSTDW
jgi:hypothetical protein